jgi:hypothetical protein
MAERYCCSNSRRGLVVEKHVTLNGIEFLEVLDAGVPVEALRQRLLLVRCYKRLLPTAAWTRDNVVLSGGVRVSGIGVDFAGVLSAVNAAAFPAIAAYLTSLQAATEANRTLLVITSARGDFSSYTVTLRASGASAQPPAGFDPVLSAVEFRFKVECPSDFDCKNEPVCVTTTQEPELDYLAKDYQSFRQLMLDRMSARMPDWKERNPADLEIALVELLAYVGDHLSYFQDWAATEAYLRTARSRVSVRRHARLLDYSMHDGTNARTWIAIEAGALADGHVVDEKTKILSGQAGDGPMVDPNSVSPLTETALIFETMAQLTLRTAHNRIEFHTWSDESCCLAEGSTSATLRYQAGMALAKGSIVVFEEVLNPESGTASGVNRTHRHAVRLIKVEGIAAPILDPVDNTRVVEVTWHAEDALPFPLCVSAVVVGAGGVEETVPNIAVARGNVVLADHGATLEKQELDPPEATARYRPRIKETPVVSLPDTPLRDVSATAAIDSDPADARPSIKLFRRLPDGSIDEKSPWTPVPDLLSSGPSAQNFVLEVESDGTAAIRFGDGQHGRAPAPGTRFAADYRLGGGTAGNAGAESLNRIAYNAAPILRVWNPMEARGGAAMESAKRVQLVAPKAFRTQKRAVTEADYAAKAKLHGEVQSAVAQFRWTGSWYTVFLTVDRKNGLPVDDSFRSSLVALLDQYRMAGHDLEIQPPEFVPLDLALRVCVTPGYFQANVKKALLSVFSNHVLEGGGTGFFHADRFTFGQRLYLSEIFETALAVPGVDSVQVLRFMRGKLPAGEIGNGYIDAAGREVLRLDNDPNFPENGKLEFEMGGGV